MKPLLVGEAAAASHGEVAIAAAAAAADVGERSVCFETALPLRRELLAVAPDRAAAADAIFELCRAPFAAVCARSLARATLADPPPAGSAVSSSSDSSSSSSSFSSRSSSSTSASSAASSAAISRISSVRAWTDALSAATSARVVSRSDRSDDESESNTPPLKPAGRTAGTVERAEDDAAASARGLRSSSSEKSGSGIVEVRFGTLAEIDRKARVHSVPTREKRGYERWDGPAGHRNATGTEAAWEGGASRVLCVVAAVWRFLCRWLDAHVRHASV